MNVLVPSFVDELEKIARLTKAEESRQTMQFAALGAGASPIVSGIKNYIGHGKISPYTNIKRWLPSQIVGGALAGGLLPAVRHTVERRNLSLAKTRRDAARQLAKSKEGENA